MKHPLLSQEEKTRLLSPEALICRLLACWLTVTAVHLIRYGGFDVLTYPEQFRQGQSWLMFLFLFAGLSLLSWLIPRFSCDPAALLASALACTIAAASRKSDFFFLLPLIFGLFFVFLYFESKNRDVLSAIRLGGRTVIVLSAVMATLCFAVMAVIGVLRYKTFFSPNFDFGIFCNMFYHIKETGLPLVSCERDALMSHFAVHLSPICYLILPIYALFPTPSTLAVCQAALLASGAIPLLLIARRKEFSPGLQLFVVGLYCFFPALSMGTFFDFHENCFLAPLLLWTVFFCLEKKRFPALLTALGVCMVKEDAPVYIFILALFLFLGEKDRLFAAVLGLMSAAYFAGAVFLLDRFGLGIMSGRYDNLIADPADGLLGVFKTAWQNPAYVMMWIFKTNDGGADKVVYLLSLLLPLGFLPLCSRKPSRYLLSAPVLINLITAYPYQYQLRFQYHFGILALLFAGLIQNIKEISRSARRVLCSLAACACLVLYCANVVPVLAANVSRYAENRERYHTMEEVLQTIPQDASVAASSFLVPHLANRHEVYEITYHTAPPYPDYVVIDAGDAGAAQTVANYEFLGYVVCGQRDGLVIVLKNEQNPPEAFD